MIVSKPVVRSLMLACLLAAPCAHAQFAVIDVASLGQLIQQARMLTQELQTVRAQLDQAQTLYRSMTGGRGMEQLLGAVNRNYLPGDWAALTAALGGVGSAYGGLAGDINAAIAGNAVLSAQQLGALSAAEQDYLGDARRAVALLQGLAAQALSNSSGRFASLQGLISAIPAAADEKGALDLAARIGAEQAMLENEQIKLATLYQAAQAAAQTAGEREREQIVAGHGRFQTRFHPAAR
jgi:type IV secretion system protein VirB5